MANQGRYQEIRAFKTLKLDIGSSRPRRTEEASEPLVPQIVFRKVADASGTDVFIFLVWLWKPEMSATTLN